MAQENVKKDSAEELKARCEEYLSGWKRERADFINYKKEESDRISSLAKFANEGLILNFLPVLDNLLLAQSHINDTGLLQVIKQFQDLLAKEGIEEIEVLGKPFDPNIMEAVEGEGETVLEEVMRGYTIHGKLIRPAKVRVTK